MKIVDQHRSGPDGARSGHEEPTPKAFLERQRSGELKRLTNGAIARKVKLDEQYRLRHKGDVARRLDLGKHRGHVAKVRKVKDVHGHHDHGHHSVHDQSWHVAHHYRGRISPRYFEGSFWSHYYGPSYYPGRCRYPRWAPWVSWSWHCYSRPICDPRPVWCRPVACVAAPRWVYWEVPVWTWAPLPVTKCGTWVDVEPVVVGTKYDLELLAIRFVDPGHPEEQLGPRFRVWFRNNSQTAITQPFDVLLFASDDEVLSGDVPQAGVRVASIGAGDVQSVDIRLGIEAYSLAEDEQDQPAPSATLHVLVDANREVSETSEANNGVKLALEEVLPVDPAAFELEPATAPAGGEVVLAGEGFGPEPGQVLLHLGGIEMEAEVLGWYDLGVQVALPDLPLAGPTQADLIVVRGDGAAANPLQITITPPEADPQTIPAPPDVTE